MDDPAGPDPIINTSISNFIFGVMMINLKIQILNTSSNIELFFLTLKKKNKNLMLNFTEDNLTEAVIARLNTDDPRSKEVITKLIHHLHAFIKDVEPSGEEWSKAIDFLTRTGQKCDDKRQEFILLSDVLGVSMLVDAIIHRHHSGATETTVQGPFHAKARHYEMGENIAKGVEHERGEATVVHGKVTDNAGNPIEGVTLDVWQSDDDGNYDITDPNMPDMNLRGIFTTGKDGKFWFKTIRPASYPVPTDGPVGEILNVMGRHPMRPAHIHFWIKAKGYEDIVTHLFAEGDEYIESDAVFGVKGSLIVPFTENNKTGDAERWGVKAPFCEVTYDFKLVNAH